MTDDEYKEHICIMVNRLISEKHISLIDSSKNGAIEYSIACKYPEWYLELDDDDKFNIDSNLQHHFKSVIQETIKEYNKDLKNKRKLEQITHKNKKHKSDE